jgi:hypothetical protein
MRGDKPAARRLLCLLVPAVIAVAVMTMMAMLVAEPENY